MKTTNKKASYPKAVGKKTTNNEGGEAFVISDRLELFNQSVNSLNYGDSYYETASEILDRHKTLIRNVSKEKGGPEFIAKLAIYIRQEIGLRDTALFLVLELAKYHSGDNLVSKALSRVIDRPDMIVTAAGMYVFLNPNNSRTFEIKNGKKIPLGKINGKNRVKNLAKLSNQVKKGLADSFNNPNFTENDFAKHFTKFENKEIKARDVLFSVHAKPSSEQRAELFKKIIDSNLKEANTWEVRLSSLGQEFKNDKKGLLAAKKLFWENILSEQDEKGRYTIGYLALLRNLRNIIEADVDGNTIKIVCSRISEGGHRIFPFQYVSAYREIKELKGKYIKSVLEALNQACINSVKTFEGFDFEDDIAISCDVSGSMQGNYINYENLTRQINRYKNNYNEQILIRKKAIKSYDVGLLLGMLAYNKCKSVEFGVFGDFCKWITLPSNNVLDNLEKFYGCSGIIREGMVGYSTNGYKVIQDLIRNNKKVNKVFIFTDCQLYGGSINEEWKKYHNKYPESKLYLFNLSVHVNAPLQIEKNNVYMISGFSEKIFTLLKYLEDGNKLLSYIDQISLD